MHTTTTYRHSIAEAKLVFLGGGGDKDKDKEIKIYSYWKHVSERPPPDGSGI